MNYAKLLCREKDISMHRGTVVRNGAICGFSFSLSRDDDGFDFDCET